MAKATCKEGIRELLDAFLVDGATPETLEVMLFSNDATISVNTVKADLTEITTDGGEKQSLSRANWGAASDASPTVASYDAGTGVTFTFTGSVQLYGYAIIGATTGKVYCVENFGQQNYSSGQHLDLNPLSLALNMIVA